MELSADGEACEGPTRCDDSEPTGWKAALDAAVTSHADEVIDLRRQLHANPEPSGAEVRTSQRLLQLLKGHGLTLRLGPNECGLLAEPTTSATLAADAAPKRHIVAFRGDIDALNIADEKEADYRSQNSGFMHACGHDAHAAIAYGVTMALCKLEAKPATCPGRLIGVQFSSPLKKPASARLKWYALALWRASDRFSRCTLIQVALSER